MLCWHYKFLSHWNLWNFRSSHRSLGACNFIKKILQHRCSKNSYFEKHLRIAASGICRSSCLSFLHGTVIKNTHSHFVKIVVFHRKQPLESQCDIFVLYFNVKSWKGCIASALYDNEKWPLLEYLDPVLCINLLKENVAIIYKPVNGFFLHFYILYDSIKKSCRIS